MRIHAHFYTGAAGGATSFFRGDEISTSDLTATFGVQLKALIPIGDFVLVGPALSFRSIHGEGGAERVSLFGIDAAFGAHYGIDLGSIAIDPYVLFGIGLGIASPQDQIGTTDTELGVNFGLRGGIDIWFMDAVGASVGMGYQQSSFYPETIFTGAESAHVRVAEFAVELGVALRFGE